MMEDKESFVSKITAARSFIYEVRKKSVLFIFKLVVNEKKKQQHRYSVIRVVCSFRFLLLVC